MYSRERQYRKPRARQDQANHKYSTRTRGKGAADEQEEVKGATNKQNANGNTGIKAPKQKIEKSLT